MNHKKTYRLYREEGLSIRPKVPRRKRACRYRQGRPEVGGPNEVWAMDFVSDQLFDGRPFRILTVVDCHTREALSTVPRVSVRAYQVVDFANPFATGLRDTSRGAELRYSDGSRMTLLGVDADDLRANDFLFV